jgi:ectoine hydroxylase-related dioxygenase (phytanoyl-CoA dioxygenase family)
MAQAITTLVSQLVFGENTGAAKPVLDELVAQLCAITDLDLHPDLFLDEHATITAQGKAVSPTTAAQCAEDVRRTSVFIQGIYAAICEKLKQKSLQNNNQKNNQNNSQKIHLLYAGTGPFGMLLIPLLPLFSAEQISVTLLDIHADSLAKLQRVIDHLGVGEFIAHCEQADACEWKSAQLFDVIISETMRQGLIQEPQVSIFSHLQQFLNADGWLIPQMIRLDLWLSSGRSSAMGAAKTPDVHLGPVFQLDKTTAAQLGRGDNSCAQGELWVPEYDRTLQSLKLTTFIQVFGDHQLHENQSQLTLPLYEHNARVLPNSILRFRYEQGTYPQCVFDYEKLPELSESALPDSLEKNAQGIYHLKRFWHKIQLRKLAHSSASAQQQLATIADDEWWLDRILLDSLHVGLEPAMQYVYRAQTLSDMEHWLASANEGAISPAQVQRTNQAILQFIENNKHELNGCELNACQLNACELNAQAGLPLNEQQLAHWDEHGYLVIPGVLSADEASAVRAAIWDFLQMREDQPETWYQPAGEMKKIMVQLFAHPAMEVARNSDYIRRIFQQLWQRTDLIMTTDRVGFNPPETKQWQFPGPGMHWDLDLVAPIPFGTQGLIYLTDVAENQGAFCCVPGFHKKIDAWLAQQPSGIDLQQQDWSLWPIKPIAANAGDLIVWHQALPHGSSPNRADFPRMVQYLTMYR